MIHSMVRITDSAGKEREVLRIFCSLSERIRALSGCIDCSVYRDARLAHTFMWTSAGIISGI